jgi:ribonuclease HI
MSLDKTTKDLLRKTLKIRDSEVPFYRVLDILATRDGDISEVCARYHDIKEAPLRAAFHYCAELLRQLAKEAGLMPTWEVEGPSTDEPPTGEQAESKKKKSSAASRKKEKPELTPFVDESARGQVKTAKIYIDGASRGNPGAAGIGIAIFTMDGRKIAQQAKAIGTTTNNIAEYTALIEALKLARDLGIEQVYVLSDSELVVRQMRGEYKIRNADILSKALEAKKLAQGFKRFSIDYIQREHNALADALSNYALNNAPPQSELSEFSPSD